MGFSQIIASGLLLLILKWGLWHIQLLQQEHQKLIQAMDVLIFRVTISQDIKKLLKTFFTKKFVYDEQSLSFLGLPLLDIGAEKWRLLNLKNEALVGTKYRLKQIRLSHCENWMNRDVFIFNEDDGQKNTALTCNEDILSLQFPLYFKTNKLFVIPIDYKTYSFRYQKKLYQVYLSHKDIKHLLDLKIKPSLKIKQGEAIQLQIGAAKWHFPVN